MDVWRSIRIKTANGAGGQYRPHYADWSRRQCSPDLLGIRPVTPRTPSGLRLTLSGLQGAGSTRRCPSGSI